jgi:hypothetical protein
VSRIAGIPAEHAVGRALERYLAECHDNGRRPSVLGLAGQLGMSNTSFRRHFPAQAQKVSGLRNAPAPAPASPNDDPPASPYDRLAARNARLRRTNRILTQNLHLAAAQVQRLARDNARLREELQKTASVTPIDQARRGPSR